MKFFNIALLGVAAAIKLQSHEDFNVAGWIQEAEVAKDELVAHL